MKKWVFRILLLALSLLFAGTLIELTLRLFIPRYDHLVKAPYQMDSLRIMSRIPNSQRDRIHPDSKQTHPVIHNNLALRHNRDIDPTSLHQGKTIAFFGDSFTENANLDAPYVFTEVLHYLINQNAEEDVHILNMGVAGYGTGQSYLYFRDWIRSHPLPDAVFHVICHNDVRNVLESDLFHVEDDGTLARKKPDLSSPAIQFASRFHLTYLAMEGYYRLVKHRDQPLEDYLTRTRNRELRRQRNNRVETYQTRAMQNQLRDVLTQKTSTLDPQLRKSLTLFLAILTTWRKEVEALGIPFYLVLLPSEIDHGFAPLLDPESRVLNLYEAFQNDFEAYSYADHVRFKNDGHWNETGNLLAARYLYRQIENDWHLPRRSEEDLMKSLFTYYSGVGGNWFPDERWVLSTPVHPEEQRQLHSFYRALEE